MNNIEELLKDAYERQSFLDESLNEVKLFQNIVPVFQGMAEDNKWVIQALSSYPGGRQELLHGETLIKYKRGTKYLIENSPFPTKINTYVTGGTIALTTSGSAAIYATVSMVSEDSNLKIQEWAKQNITVYRENQENQKRVERVKEFLLLLNPDRIGELETAEKSYKAAVAGVGTRKSAGNDMRNLLNHYKGDLFEKARKWPKENKLKWEAMADRLALNGVNGDEHSELLMQEEIWGSLQEKLTHITKGHTQGLSINLDNIWSQLIDHLFTVLGIVTLE